MNSSRPGSVVLQVFVFRDGDLLGDDMFVEREVTLGRDPATSDLVLDSEQVSREHAVLVHDGQRVIVRDLESTHGIFVNGERVTEAEVGRLDELAIANYTIKCKLIAKNRRATAKASEPPPATAPVVAPVVTGDEPTRLMSVPSVVVETGDSRGRVSTPPELPPESTDEVQIPDLNRTKAPAEPAPDETLVGARPASAPAERSPSGTVRPLRPGPQRPTTVAAAPRAASKSTSRSSSSAEGADGPRRNKATSLDTLPQAVSDDDAASAAPRHSDGRPPRAALGVMPSPVAVAPPTHLHVRDDDDDDDEEAFVSPFSLSEAIFDEDRDVASPAKPRSAVLELITVRDGSVVDLVFLSQGQTHWIGATPGGRFAKELPARLPLVRYYKAGHARVEFRSRESARRRRTGTWAPVGDDAAQKGAQKKRDSKYFELPAGEVAHVTDGANEYHIRFVEPPVVRDDGPNWRSIFTLDSERLVERAKKLWSFATSTVVHLLVLLLMSALALSPPPPATGPTDDFVEVALEQELALEAPPEPEVAPEPVPEPEPKELKAEKPPPREKQAAPTKKPTPGGVTAEKPAGVLGLLSKKGSLAAPGPATALAAVSNLSATKVPGGSSGFKVSGLTGKLPTSQISAGGGGGGLVTGGAELLRGGGGGAGKLSGTGTRAVGGTVVKAPPSSIARSGQGQLDPGEVMKVINKNIGKIQRCYESALLREPGLAGKVQLEWVISTSGSVKSVRQKSADLNSTAAITCMLNSIKGWEFPAPRGGEAVVSYPFVFKAM